MAIELKRMWINQPSANQVFHALDGVNVLAYPESDTVTRIYFLDGPVFSQQLPSLVLCNGWVNNTRDVKGSDTKEVVEVVSGVHRALARMIDKHDPDSIESEWLSHSNELHRKLTGNDIPAPKPVFVQERAAVLDETENSLDEIKLVAQVSIDGEDYVVQCPHCSKIIAVEGDTLSQIQGEQYQHAKCGGWLQVTYEAKLVPQL